MDRPTLVKEFVVAHAGRNFVNGTQEFDLTTDDMDEMCKNFAQTGKQVKVYLDRGIGHPPKSMRGALPADGWIETLTRKGNDLVAGAKLYDEAAVVVMGDLFRGCSIGAFEDDDRHGKPIGWTLDHLLITNDAFFNDLNIAARRAPGGAETVLYLTARPLEATMADDKKEITLAEVERKHADEIKAKDNSILELRQQLLSKDARIESLTEQLDNVKVDPDKERLAARVASLELKTKAQEIRELVSEGLKRGTLKPSWCDGFNKKGDAGTMDWFEKHPRFLGDMKLLTYQVKETDPVVRLGQTYASGSGGEDKPQAALTAEDKRFLKSKGIDPEKASRGRARNLAEYRQNLAEAKEA